MTNTPCRKNDNKVITFSDAVNRYLKTKRITQADLIRKSQLTRTTVSRICRNSNDEGSSYQPTDRVVMSICVALELNHTETAEMFALAFPYFPYWHEIIEKRMDIFRQMRSLMNRACPCLEVRPKNKVCRLAVCRVAFFMFRRGSSLRFFICYNKDRSKVRTADRN